MSTAAVTAVPPAAPVNERAGALPTPTEQALAAKDRTLTSAAVIEAARRVLSEITELSNVGEHVAARRVAERLVTHLFECSLAGYRGWRWAVTVARPPRGRSATICEMELLPGEDALLAPAWIPWADRLQPGDVSRSDRLPRRETDERLEPGWEATGDEEGDAVALDELDLGRARVLSPEGVSRAAQRWYDGDHGPEAEGVRKAHATCSTCGFFIRMAGPLRSVFGICANEWAADDGRVVSLDHGCGAHSETDLLDEDPEWPVTPARLDENAMDPLGTDGMSIRAGQNQADFLAGPTPTRDARQSAPDGGESQEDGSIEGDGSAGADEDREPPADPGAAVGPEVAVGADAAAGSDAAVGSDAAAEPDAVGSDGAADPGAAVDSDATAEPDPVGVAPQTAQEAPAGEADRHEVDGHVAEAQVEDSWERTDPVQTTDAVTPTDEASETEGSAHADAGTAESSNAGEERTGGASKPLPAGVDEGGGECAEALVGPGTQTRADDPVEDRAAAAREAVAGLMPKRSATPVRDPEASATSLAELEALLPRR